MRDVARLAPNWHIFMSQDSVLDPWELDEDDAQRATTQRITRRDRLFNPVF